TIEDMPKKKKTTVVEQGGLFDLDEQARTSKREDSKREDSKREDSKREDSKREETLDEIRAECGHCSDLCKSRINLVFGEGNPKAELMFIGEAPGADEDATGRPFVG